MYESALPPPYGHRTDTTRPKCHNMTTHRLGYVSIHPFTHLLTKPYPTTTDTDTDDRPHNKPHHTTPPPAR